MIYSILSDAVVLSILPCIGFLFAYIYMVANEDKVVAKASVGKSSIKRQVKKRTFNQRTQTFLRAA